MGREKGRPLKLRKGGLHALGNRLLADDVRRTRRTADARCRAGRGAGRGAAFRRDAVRRGRRPRRLVRLCRLPRQPIARGTGIQRPVFVHVLEPDRAPLTVSARSCTPRGCMVGRRSTGSTPTRSALHREPGQRGVLGQGTVGRVPLQEVSRVLCPGGVLFAPIEGIRAAELAAAGLEPLPPSRREGAVWRGAKKPWPSDMDQWSHARHAADGNAVSQDAEVAPPRRVRWLAGPPQEISNIVTGGGRAFFAGVIARDGFNGLRLWERTLNPLPARGGFYFDVVEGGVQPVAAADCLLVVTDKRLRAGRRDRPRNPRVSGGRPARRSARGRRHDPGHRPGDDPRPCALTRPNCAGARVPAPIHGGGRRHGLFRRARLGRGSRGIVGLPQPVHRRHSLAPAAR